MQPGTDQKLCQHRDAQLSFAARDLTDAVRRALAAREGSPKRARLLGEVEEAKRKVAGTREFIQTHGPRCGYCTERESASKGGDPGGNDA